MAEAGQELRLEGTEILNYFTSCPTGNLHNQVCIWCCVECIENLKALHSFPLIFVSLQNNKEPTFRLGEKHTLLVELGCSMGPSQLSFSKDILLLLRIEV